MDLHRRHSFCMKKQRRASHCASVWRQSAALATSRELQQLQKTRGALEVTKSGVIADIHRDKSRAVLVPLVERRLGLRLPQDSEITILQDPRPR